MFPEINLRTFFTSSHNHHEETRRFFYITLNLLYTRRPESFGFSHLIDELSNALNPESGLPRHLLLDPKSMDRVSVPQAVERVAAINAWRAAQKAEADALRANNAATVLHKDYPDKGYKWVELRPGEQLNPEYELKQIQGKNGSYWDLRKPGAPYGHTTNTELEALKASNRDALADALKYEGDTMGHCVGGYCDDVLSGRSRIYSLRDAKGEPHVTIEVAPPSTSEHVDSNIKVNRIKELLGDRYQEYLYKRGFPKYQGSTALEILEKEYPDVYTAYKAELPEQPPRIVQIKGKQNRAPNEEYLPFVQDFVRSGRWSDVGDLQNAGLVDISRYPKRVEKFGTRYITEPELNEYLDSFPPNMVSPPEGFAHGGSVSTPVTVSDLRAIIATLRMEHSNA